VKDASSKTIPHWLESWHVDPSANREYDFIDGLRGLAILMVVACHHLYVNPKSGPAVLFFGCVFGTSGLGVALFFTLSGFLIAWPFWRRKVNRAEQAIPPGYGWRRFWKIYPPLALSVLLLTPTYILWHGDAPLYLHATMQWLTGLAFLMPVSGKLNPVMWSLVVEIHFYLVLPLLFLLAKSLSPKKTLWLISLFFLVVPVATRAATGLSPTFFPVISDPFPTGLDSFCLGVCLAGIDNLKIWDKNWARLGDVGCFLMPLGLLGQAWIRLHPENHGTGITQTFIWTFLLGAGFLLCYAADPQNPRAKMLCTPWLRWCGIISYEWYLFHQPMVYWSRGLFGHAGGNIFKYSLIVLLPLVASLTFSALVYRLFSLPLLQYGRARKSARK
jgi:peptidoglycan/LPS O-acetylase OafA/YrhL